MCAWWKYRLSDDALAPAKRNLMATDSQCCSISDEGGNRVRDNGVKYGVKSNTGIRLELDRRR